MRGRTARIRALTAIGAAAVLAGGALASCSPGRHRQATTPTSPAPVVVASFNFEESVVIADIYAQALQHAGIPVRLELNLGPREMVLPAVRQGMVDVVPEYLGSLLAAVEPGVERQGSTAAEERSQLAQALSSWDVQVLRAAPGQDQNGLVVTQALAQDFGLRAVSDLAPFAPRLTLGAPTECPSRPFCLVGFQAVYGLHFARFDAFDAESQRITALEQQVVDVALMNTTDGVLATGRFVPLGDDRSLQPADNVAPIVSSRAISTFGARVASALDAVSARLTTPELTFLNWRVGVAGNDAGSEAKGWLQREGLVPRG